MISFKMEEELALMRESGLLSAWAMEKVLGKVRAGIKRSELDRIARQEIVRRGGQPSFETVPGYRWATCITVNEEVVHGVPSDEVVKEGDVLSIDLGTLFEGWHSDMARTVIIGKADRKTQEFVKTGSLALEEALRQVKPGGRIGDISEAIQRVVEGRGYKVIRALTGHGIGRQLHEDPFVPGYGRRGEGPKILEGLALAVEVIYSQSSEEVVYKNQDGWTLRSADNSLSGLFEDTIAVGKKGPVVLTRKGNPAKIAI